MSILPPIFRKISDNKVGIIFILLGFLIYCNSLNNGYISDDYLLIINNPLVNSISNIGRAITHANFLSVDTNNYYRPAFAALHNFIFFLFGGRSFGFHLIQISIHIANTFLIFLLLKHFFKRETSVILSLIFLVHPMNTQAVVYISALKEPLFVLFGLLALYYTIERHKKPYSLYIVALFGLIALFAKETAVIFLFLVPAFDYLFRKGKTLFAHIAQGISALSIYFFFRFAVAGVFFNRLDVVPIMKLSLWERTLSIPKIIFFYLKTFFYPKHLITFQSWVVETINFKDFYFPLIVAISFFSLLTLLGVLIYKKNRKFLNIFLFFFVWFSLGLAVHLQIFPIDQTVDDQYFYFPMIGLLGMIGVLIEHFKIPSRFRLISLLIVLTIIGLFSIRVIIRNMDWKNEASLYTHDIKFNKDSFQLVKGLGVLAFYEGGLDEAEAYFIHSTQLYPSEMSYNSLGYYYLKTEKYEEATRAFEKAVSYKEDLAVSWGNLALAEYKSGDKESAINSAKTAH